MVNLPIALESAKYTYTTLELDNEKKKWIRVDRAEKQRTILQNDTEMILNQYLQISSQYIFLSRRDNYFPKEQMNV